ncbi:ankyrin repeat-containing protein At5g02620-like isoform X4 [Camellia sinensis]|uniref:ankyrin repeat-containing protein At5g02620-like isoform X4 n=1 Tax=Camellia sinensis TaxID=4442 RepID=UPI001036A19B|nr:ankyrin repeat-containing protein At5g02620-like isoform X4 [Camellia sinensis]
MESQVLMDASSSSRGARENKDEDYWRYQPLLKAALRGDWDSAKGFFDQDPDALTAHITDAKQTALHLAISSGRSIEFVEKLVDLMPPEALALRASQGRTALHIAALYGNTKAAVILVEKHPTSLYIRSYDQNQLPLHFAANGGHKDTLLYLLSVTEDDPVSKPFAYPSGALLLYQAVDSEFYGSSARTNPPAEHYIALDLVGRHPELGTSKLVDDKHALKTMARKASAFPSSIRLNRWQRLIYSYVPVENYADQDHNRSDIENPVNSSQVIAQKHSWARILGTNFPNSVSRKLQAMLWKVLELLATRYGIHEVVEEVVESFPQAIWYVDNDGYNIFGLAVIYRCENVFNLIYQMSGHKQDMMFVVDKNWNTMLHLAGRLAPFDKLNLVPGAALQMQRELQWFKEVENLVTPGYKEYQNEGNEFPSMVFTKEHKKLVEEGEKWMKDTANSCTIAAALIATIAFAAVITVPGGTNGTNGVPVFSKANAFIVFIVSDAISLFTSTMSLLMFLSILTSRYAEGDFLYVLPKRLIIGLVTLFMSITTMILAFSSTLYLVFGNNKEWILIPVAALACLPITSFMFLQFPLLVDLISSTYGPGIFGKKSDRFFF